MKLTTKILLGMALGVITGLIFNVMGDGAVPSGFKIAVVDGVFDSVGRIFVAALKLLVVPVVFFSLTCGAAAMGVDIRMGKMAVHTLLLYLFTTCAAVTLALLVATVIDPGLGFNLGEIGAFEPRDVPSVKETLINIVPTNPIEAMVSGNMLQLIVFCILLGVSVSLAGDAGKRALKVLQSFNDVILKMVTVIMHLAPYGVFCLLAKIFADLGADAFEGLAKYFVTVALALVLHAFGVYSALLKLFTGLNPITFFKNVRPAMLFAFSTSSSAATMPITMNVAEKRLGVDNRVASLTIPVGATINMDGTAIMQGVATVFIAQAFGADLGMGGYLTVILTATLASIGTAAVPSVGLVMLTMVLQQVGLPVEGIALIIGVDRLLDMMRTAVNVTGDCAVTSIVAKYNNMLDEKVFNEVSDRDEYEQRTEAKDPQTKD